MLFFAALPVRADCDWRWYCDRSGACGFVPYCDSPHDKPPPLQGMAPPSGGASGKPVAPEQSQRKPLPGYKPVNPPPPAAPPAKTAAPPIENKSGPELPENKNCDD
jgi:hypothetical protein